MQVVLKCAFDIPSMGLRLAGTVVDVEGDDLELMQQRGVIADASDKPAPEPANSEPEPDPEPGPDPKPATVGKPLKTASIDTWRAYGAHLGIDVKGMKKPDIIAAVGAIT